MLRIVLIYAACWIAGTCYAWLRLAREFGITPALVALPSMMLDRAAIIVMGAVLFGAFALWSRTRHRAALIQLVTSAIVFVLTGLDEVGRVLDDYGMPRLLDLVRLRISLALHVIYVACLIALPAAYIWYARSQKRI